MSSSIVVLYQDESLLAIDKPSGLAVHRGWATDPVVALTLARRAALARVYPVHRLDRGTSGVLLFALDPGTARLLGEAFAQGAVEKCYLAIVRGVAPEACIVDHPIPRREGGPRVPAVTAIERLHALDHMSVVAARPRTGRLHQVRRHLKHLSHPILGDSTYGKGPLNREVRGRFGLARLALHASSLTFAHPHGGAPLTIEAPLPADLRDPLSRMGLAWPEGG